MCRAPSARGSTLVCIESVLRPGERLEACTIEGSTPAMLLEPSTGEVRRVVWVDGFKGTGNHD
jgi:hypothetical protein